jgi:hypothetical protein
MQRKSFDIGTGIIFFFKQVGARPMSALWLTAWHVGLSIVLAVLAMWVMSPFWGEVFVWAESNHDPEVEEVFRVLGPVVLAMPFLFLGGILSWLMMNSAWMRFLARDEIAAGIPYRIGSDELRFLGVTLLALVVMWAVQTVLGIVLAALGLGAGGLMMIADGDAAAVLSGGLFMLIAVLGSLVASLYITVKLSAATGLSFVDRKFRFFESWDATKDNFWGILVSYLAIGVLIYFMAIFLMIFFGLTMAGTLMPLVGELEAIGDPDFATAREGLDAVKSVLMVPAVMIPLGIVILVGTAFEVVMAGMFMGVGAYTARLYRENTPFEDGDSPTLDGAHPAGASPSEG